MAFSFHFNKTQKKHVFLIPFKSKLTQTPANEISIVIYFNISRPRYFCNYLP